MAVTAEEQTGNREYREELSALPHAVSCMRRIVAAYVSLWGLEQLEADAELCASELLSNVGKHAESPDCVLTLQRGADGVRLVVSDSSSALPVLREADWIAESGRGLIVLQGVADAWGAEPTVEGKDVWVELRMAAAAMEAGLGTACHPAEHGAGSTG